MKTETRIPPCFGHKESRRIEGEDPLYDCTCPPETNAECTQKSTRAENVKRTIKTTEPYHDAFRPSFWKNPIGWLFGYHDVLTDRPYCPHCHSYNVKEEGFPKHNHRHLCHACRKRVWISYE